MFSAFKKKDPGKKHSGSPPSENYFMVPQILPPLPQRQLPCDLLDKAWRNLDWTKRNDVKERLRGFQISTPDIGKLRILVHGPAGAGKSSFINSIDSIFQERMTSGALAEAATGRSFTKTLQTHFIKDQKYGSFLPFALCDIMGLEGGQVVGVETDDLISVLNGHIKDGYTFNPAKPCSTNDPGYNRNPKLSDRIHCLVSVFPASNISLAGNGIFNKMKEIRAKAVGIPQVAVLTKVDDTCPKVAEDLKRVYMSKRIKEKMQEYSNRLGIPMNCIFPVKCYHEEIQLNNVVDVLLLSALNFILNAANDHVAVMATAPADVMATFPAGPAEMATNPVADTKNKKADMETHAMVDAENQMAEKASPPADSSGIYESVMEVSDEEEYGNNITGEQSPPPSPPPSHTPPSPSTIKRKPALPPRRGSTVPPDPSDLLAGPPWSPLTTGEKPALPLRRGSTVPPDPSDLLAGPPWSPLTTGEKPALPLRRGSTVPPDPSDPLAGPPSSPLTTGEEPALPLRRGSMVPPDPSEPLAGPPWSPLTTGEKPALPLRRGSMVPPDPSEPLAGPPWSPLTTGEKPALPLRRGSMVPPDPSEPLAGPPWSPLTTGEKPALPLRRGSTVPPDPSDPLAGPPSSPVTTGEKPALPPRRGSMVPPDPSDPLAGPPSSPLNTGEEPALPLRRGSTVPPDPSDPPVTPLSPSSSPPSSSYLPKKPVFPPQRVNMADKHLPFKYADMDSRMKTH